MGMANLKKDIEALEKIQDLDREIYQSRELIREIPVELRELDRALEEERRTLKAIEEDLKSLQLKQKQKEANLQDKEASIQKLESQLAQVKTNKEYAALQSEIRSAKADNSLLEEDIIRLIDGVEECQARLADERKRLAEIEKESNLNKSVFTEKLKVLERRVDELTAQKKAMFKDINPDIGDLYERIVQNRQGIGLVKVDGEVCPACQMQLRPQQINELQLADKIVICEQCSRILYWASPSIA